jgi:integrase
MTFLQTGIRLSELTALKVEDIDFENRLLIVRQGKGRKDRLIPLVDEEVPLWPEANRRLPGPQTRRHPQILRLPRRQVQQLKEQYRAN